MTGTSTAKALWEGACKCVPSDTQVWTLENDVISNTGVRLGCCPPTPSDTPGLECPVQTFETSGSLNATANIPFVCGSIACSGGTGNVIIDCINIAFRNFDCRRRCWTNQILGNVTGYNPNASRTAPTLATPCRLYLTAGSWTPTALDFFGQVTIAPNTKIEILKALDGIINCFISCVGDCAPFTTTAALIPDTLVDTSILLYAFNRGGFCGNYFDSNGDPIQSAAQFVRDVLAGEDILFDCTSPVNTGDCGCLCANESAVTINLCDYPCLASRLICTEKLVWTLNSYINCHRPRSCCGTCLPGTV